MLAMPAESRDGVCMIEVTLDVIVLMVGLVLTL